MCSLLSNSGFEHGFEQQTLSLEADHWIAFDLSGETQGMRATFNYQRKEQRTVIPMMIAPGIKFLPLVHTELDAGSPSRRRHFVGIFTWTPSQPGAWALNWSLYEIVGLEVVPAVAHAIVTTIEAEQPTAEHSDVARTMTHVPATRSATIQLVGVEFVSESGTRVRQSKPIVLTAPYGMSFG